MRGKLGVISLLFSWLISLLLIIVLFSGCARTVTQIVPYGTQMLVEVTLRGTMEVNNNRYFLVLSSNKDFKIPLPPPYELAEAPEFIEPGIIPQLGSIESYYNHFFSTWSGYVVIEPAGFFTVKGPFVLGQVVSREIFASLEEQNNIIKFNFDLSLIFGTAIPDTIYFDFVTVDWPEGSAKIPKDHLTLTDAYISKVSGSKKTIDNLSDESLKDSLDILRCVVVIQ